MVLSICSRFQKQTSVRLPIEWLPFNQRRQALTPWNLSFLGWMVLPIWEGVTSPWNWH